MARSRPANQRWVSCSNGTFRLQWFLKLEATPRADNLCKALRMMQNASKIDVFYE